MPRSPSTLVSGLLLMVLALTFCTGCPVVSNLPAPGRVLRETDPVYDRAYRLYVPSHYADDRRWPLLIACHGTPPWDTSKGQLDQWKGWAEQKGFVLAAPELVGTAADLGHGPLKQIERQKQDEEAILSIVRSISASRSIEPTQVFLTGWSAGCYAVLFTGLRHPEIFRAMSLSQGNFDPAFVEPCIPFLDRHQSIQVIYGTGDALKKSSLACIDWLRSQDLDPITLGRPGFHRRDPSPVFDFFTQVLRHSPYIRVRARYDADDPMRVHFSTKSSFTPVRCQWDFGDDSGATQEKTTHTYTHPGLYVVRVALWGPGNKRYVRSVRVQVPRIRMGTAPADTTASR